MNPCRCGFSTGACQSGVGASHVQHGGPRLTQYIEQTGGLPVGRGARVKETPCSTRQVSQLENSSSKSNPENPLLSVYSLSIKAFLKNLGSWVKELRAAPKSPGCSSREFKSHFLHPHGESQPLHTAHVQPKYMT